MKTKSLLAIFFFIFIACTEKGKDGEKGPAGPTGAPGVPGAPGASPSLIVRPATALECPSGGSVVILEAVDNVICNGSNGQNGSNGSNGSNGTVITLLPVCPGVSTYPSVFLEYGICINNDLFGVYSQMGGFLALLPPGNYVSNAIGSHCNFTITSGCGITW